jgi:enolase-phosphatase E1
MSPLKPRLFLLDVEGTIAPLSLIYEQLVPYARSHFAQFLRQRGGEAAIVGDLTLLAEENRADVETTRPPFNDPQDPEAALPYIEWLMELDRKSTALKSLQGRIWKGGFEKGELKGTLFADVPPALERWSSHGQVAIYSSGSVAAQLLLFRYSTFGDLTPLIAGYFDTRTGLKTASASYEAIAMAMNVQTRETIFFSDVVRELDAAKAADCQTRLVMREGNAAVEDAHGHVRIKSFAGI